MGRDEFRPGLGREEIHVWLCDPDQVGDAGLLERYGAMMTPGELERNARFVFEKHRHQFRVARALVRTTLSRYADVPPHAWRFVANRYGRPEIDAPAGLPPLRFNLSHCDGLIAVAVGLERDFGVDVEDVHRQGSWLSIADRFFSPLEVRDLRAMPPEGQLERFFDYWTLKESYIKARGMGLSLPLEQFSFHLQAGRPVSISFDPRLEDDPVQWQFEQLRPTSRHKTALGIRRGQGPDLQVKVWWTVPLERDWAFFTPPASR